MGKIADVINKIGYALTKNKKYEAWAQKQWDKWGSKLSPTYNNIKKWEFTKEQNELLASILVALPKNIQALLIKFVDKIWAFAVNHYDKDILSKWLEQVIEFVKKTIAGLKED